MNGRGDQKQSKQQALTKKFPNVYALLFILCTVAMLLTWIVPAGAFDRVASGKISRVIAGSFHYIKGNPQTPWNMLQAIFQGYIKSSQTIFMIFFVGSAIQMLEENKCLSTTFTVMARKLQGKEALTIALVMFSLGLGNSAGVFGNIGLAIIPIGMFLTRAIGGDDFLGFMIIYFGMQSGFSIGFANPNVLGVAQMIAEVPVFSGTGPRAVCCILNIIFMYLVTWNYYKKIKKDPTKSLNYGSGMLLSSENDTLGKTSDKITQNFLTQRQTIVVGTFLIGVIICVGMTIKFGWKANKIGSYFLGMGVVAGILSGFSMNDIAKKFIKGCGPMVTASFVVGIASAVSVILNNGKILDTLVNWVSIPLAQLGPVLGAGFMVVVNALINILIPSGSGQAAVVMPLMTPMADIIGITRQVTVQAFQFGDGLSNLITPLNGTLMGGLAMAHVEFPRYFKWVINIIAGQVFVAAIVTMLLQYVPILYSLLFISIFRCRTSSFYFIKRIFILAN